MKYVLSALALVLAAALAAVVAFGDIPLVTGDEAEVQDGCRQVEQAEIEDQAVFLTVIGDNQSDLDNQEVHLRHLEEVVLPAAGKAGARVVVGTISALSVGNPVVIADLSMAPTGDGADNPEVQADATTQTTRRVMACTRAALAAAATSGKSPATDVFGAIEWASSVVPAGSSTVQLSLLTDSINTASKACDFNQQRIGPEQWDHLFATCAKGDYTALRGSTVWLGGIGLDDGDPDTKQPATADLQALWMEFFARHGATVTKAGPTILPGN